MVLPLYVPPTNPQLLKMSKQKVRVIHPTPNIKKGVSYWEDEVEATVNGVLGGK